MKQLLNRLVMHDSLDSPMMDMDFNKHRFVFIVGSPKSFAAADCLRSFISHSGTSITYELFGTHADMSILHQKNSANENEGLIARGAVISAKSLQGSTSSACIRCSRATLTLRTSRTCT